MIWYQDSCDTQPRRAPIINAAFSKSSHALIAASLLTLTSVSPSVVEQLAPAPASKVYFGIPPIYGNYATIGTEIAKPGKIDVLILGSSDAWTAIDPVRVKAYLDERTGKQLRVLNLSTNWAGDEKSAQVTRDILDSHEVELVLFPETDASPMAPHELAKYWWRGNVETSGLPLRNRAQLAMMNVIGFPRRLWSRAQSRESAPMQEQYEVYLGQQIKKLGFNASRLGWRSNSEPDESKRRPFEELTAPEPASTGASIFLDAGNPDAFQVRSDPYTPMQTTFIVAARDMVRAQGGVFATFSIPSHFQTTPLEKPWIREHVGVERDWPTIGISQTDLFPGLSFDEILNYYSNESHFNENGARAYTDALLPAIGDLYEQAADN